MRSHLKNIISLVLVFTMIITLAGCTGKKKPDSTSSEDKVTTTDNKSDNKNKSKTTSTPGKTTAPTPAKTTTKAGGKGNNSSDMPLVISCTKISKTINPFDKLSEDDEKAVELTQMSLLTFDRENEVVNKAIDGETRVYNGKDYTYTGAADITIDYNKKSDRTTYTITLKSNIVFSDEKKVTADDIIFSLYAFSDKSYKGSYSLAGTDILGESSYNSGKSDDIKGIIKSDDYTVKVITDGYNKSMINELDIPVCPLHYYGNEDKYDYDNNKFGLTKGKIQTLLKKKNTLLGAGPYKFVKYETGIMYFEANENYYKDCPQIAFVQLKKTGKISDSQVINNIAQGLYDVGEIGGSMIASEVIEAANSNKKVNGSTLSTRMIDGDSYQTICINAKNVNVNNRPDSNKSKCLRKAFACLFAANRWQIVDTYYADSAVVINYPYADTSWAVPQPADDDYKESYAYDSDGKALFDKDMDATDRAKAAMKEAIKYFKKAGYKFKDGKVAGKSTSLPSVYKLTLNIETDVNSSMYKYMTGISKSLYNIGINLKVSYLGEANISKSVKKDKLQMWCQSFSTQTDADMYSLYYGNYSFTNNMFGISDSNLDEIIQASRNQLSFDKKAEYYKKCFNKISDWAIQVPMFQLRDYIVFSSSRIDLETMTEDITPYYGWMDEIEKIEMK